MLNIFKILDPPTCTISIQASVRITFTVVPIAISTVATAVISAAVITIVLFVQEISFTRYVIIESPWGEAKSWQTMRWSFRIKFIYIHQITISNTYDFNDPVDKVQSTWSLWIS